MVVKGGSAPPSVNYQLTDLASDLHDQKNGGRHRCCPQTLSRPIDFKSMSTPR